MPHLCDIPWASHNLRQLCVGPLPSCGTKPCVGLMTEFTELREMEEDEEEMEVWLWSMAFSLSPQMPWSTSCW